MPGIDRWWSDVEKAHGALGVVGGPNVAQSVGTVALGYHAVLADRLRPLAAATLVDHADVAKVLDEVDLDPVTKALAVAVEPVLGPAAEVYAIDLMDTLHTEARDGLRYELQVLTAKGVPWPQAIERACNVVGVPARALNGFVQKMAAPQVNPAVLADEADRTLMTWASRLGKREATPVLEGVDKAAGHEQEWDPQEHPRSASTGRFVDAPDEAEPEVDRRASRLSRLRRMAGLQARSDADRIQRAKETERRKAAEKKSLAELQAEVLGRAGARAQAGRAQRGRAQAGRAQAGRAQATRSQARQSVESRTRALESFETAPKQRGGAGYQLNGYAAMDIPPESVVLNEVGDILSGAQLARLGDVKESPGHLTPGQTRLVISAAYVSHDNGDGTFELDPNYDYQVVGAGINGLDLELKLEPISDVDKADSDWDPQEHPRSEETGRFVDAPDKTGERGDRLDRLRRLNRLSRLQGQEIRQREAQQQETRNEKSLAAAAALQRVQTGRAQRGRAQAGRLRATRTQLDRAQRDANLRAQASFALSEGRKARAAHDTKADVFRRERPAMLVEDSLIAELTSHYPGDDVLVDGVWLRDLDASPSERKAMFKNVHLVAGDQVSEALAADAWQSIRQLPRNDRSVKLSEHFYDTPAQAMQAAREEMLGTEVINESEVYVAGAEPVAVHGDKAFYSPVAYRQPLSDDGYPETSKSVVVGDDAAMVRLRNGDIDGLVIRRVGDTGLGAAEVERMGGGSHEQLADVEFNTAVFEVVDMRDPPRRRA